MGGHAGQCIHVSHKSGGRVQESRLLNEHVLCSMREGLAGKAAEWICLVQCGGSGWEGRLIHAYMGLVQYWGEGLGG